MKLVLRNDVDGLGKRGDLVEVADGYGRNYLVPRGLALLATDGIQAQADAMRRARQLRDAADREAAEEIASRLVSTPVTVTARSGEGGKLFGSVTPADIAARVAEQTGIELDRRQITLDEPIKEIGSHQARVKLHADVEFPVTVEVAAD